MTEMQPFTLTYALEIRLKGSNLTLDGRLIEEDFERPVKVE